VVRDLKHTYSRGWIACRLRSLHHSWSRHHVFFTRFISERSRTVFQNPYPVDSTLIAPVTVNVSETESESLLARGQCCAPCLPLQPRASKWQVVSLRLEIVCEILQVKGYKYGDRAKPRIYMWRIWRKCSLFGNNKSFIKIKKNNNSDTSRYVGTGN